MDSVYTHSYTDSQHRAEVIALWSEVFGHKTEHNRPDLVINQKVAFDDGLFFVALADEKVIGTVMAGYDGHRRWLYSLAVSPTHRRCGVGSQLVRHAEAVLAKRGCLKVNLQILAENEKVSEFYAALGFAVEPRVSMGKKL